MATYTTPTNVPTGTIYTEAWSTVVRDDLIFLYERLAMAGRAPFAYAYGMNITDTFATARTLAAAGGSTIFPINLDAWMFVQSLSIRNLDTATARSWEWRLFGEPDGGSATLTEVAGINGSESFTPGGAASTRTANATTPALVAPGMYWIVVRNSHASNSFDIGAGSSGSIAANTTRTKSGVAVLTTTIDAVTGWTPATAWIGARLNARVFAEGAAY